MEPGEGDILTSADPLPGTQRVFRRLSVDTHFTPITQNQVLVEWALDPGFIQPGPYTFTLYRGETVEPGTDDWTAVARVVDQPWAYDRNPKLPEKGMNIFYKVLLEDDDGQVVESQAVSGVSYWGRYDWTLAKDIIRKETMLLRKRTGVPGYLFKRRTFGELCDCVDPESGQILEDDCGSCFGTGFQGGYYEPFEYWVSMNPTQQLKKLDADQGLLVRNIETVRALAYPTPQANDFWVHAHTGQRFVVGSQITALARHRGIDLILQLMLEEQGRSDAIYQVPLPCGS